MNLDEFVIDPINDNFERIDYVMKKFGIAQSTVFSYINRGRIPKGFKISAKMTVWPKSLIDESFKRFCIANKIKIK